MDSVVNNLMNSWDQVVTETEKKRNSFFNLSNKSSSDHTKQQSELHAQPSTTSIPSISSQQEPLPEPTVPSSSIFSSSQITDKLVERIISMALPPSSESQFTQGVITERLEMQKARPSLSVPLMSRNFIMLNSRLSIPFEIIDEIIKLLSWHNPSYTLSMLIICTNLILNPIWLLISPFLYILFGIMSPAYSKHHPSEKSVLPNNPVPSRGFPLVEVSTPKPVPELSREFVLNLTDLQNHMLLYVIAFDFFNWIVIEFCYFKDEAVSSFIFLLLLSSTVGISLILPILIKFLPLLRMGQFALVIMLWSFIILLHPSLRDQLLIFFYSEETRLKILTLTNKLEIFVNNELQFVEEQELRQVEIFEIQYLNPETKNWSFIGYSTDFYSINTTTRKLNLPINGSQSLQNISPPMDWDYVPGIHSSTSNWKLDLNPKEWVKDNNVSDVIEIDEDEKWCYDKVKDNNQTLQIRRRRWCRDVIRSFQVEEILALSKKQEQETTTTAVAENTTKPREKKYNLGNDLYKMNDNDDEKRNSNYILDNQYNNHMRKKSGNKW